MAFLFGLVVPMAGLAIGRPDRGSAMRGKLKAAEEFWRSCGAAGCGNMPHARAPTAASPGVNTSASVGAIRIDRIVESICTEFAPLSFYPESTPEDWARHKGWMEPRALDPKTGNLVFTIQAFLVRTSRHTILVDTCVGNDKPRAHRLFWNMLKLDTFLPRLAAAGVQPEQVDYVMCTHMHVDHIGWNTRLRDGRWVPTFPNARYVFARKEWEATEAAHRARPQPQFADSVLPLMEARKADLVDADHALDDEVRLEPTPGHTPGHVCVHLASRGTEGVITGDCIHSPVQCLEPGWATRADADAALARATRREFLERHCERGSTVCATHFPEPSFGRFVRRGGAFWFDEAGPG
jgi:glyoxylase-like metal-dependent hydrolase (beta-lactamase superfamily II)